MSSDNSCPEREGVNLFPLSIGGGAFRAARHRNMARAKLKGAGLERWIEKTVKKQPGLLEVEHQNFHRAVLVGQNGICDA
jgi:hypothetical protein